MPPEADTLEAPVEVVTTPVATSQAQADFIKDTNARLDEHFAEKGDEPLVAPVVAPTIEPPAEEEGSDDPTDLAPEWITDDIKAEAIEYGFDPDDLAAFNNAAQLRAVMRRADRQLFGGAPQPNTAVERTPPAKAEPTSTAAPAPTGTVDEVLASLKASYGDDEPIVKFAEMLSADLKAAREEASRANAHFQQQEQAHQYAAQVAELNQLEQHVVALGLTDTFGKSFHDATPAQKENWKQIVAAYQGKGLQPTAITAKRVVGFAFPDQLQKQAKQEMARTVRKQSATRLGGGTRATPTAAYEGPVENDPVLHQAFRDLSKDPNARLSAR